MISSLGNKEPHHTSINVNEGGRWGQFDETPPYLKRGPCWNDDMGAGSSTEQSEKHNLEKTKFCRQSLREENMTGMI